MSYEWIFSDKFVVGAAAITVAAYGLYKIWKWWRFEDEYFQRITHSGSPVCIYTWKIIAHILSYLITSTISPVSDSYNHAVIATSDQEVVHGVQSVCVFQN